MNIFHWMNSFLKRMHIGARIDPVRDWLVLLICAAITLMSIVVWNVWAFDTIARGGVIGSSAISPSSVFDNSSLDVIHTIFTNRAAEEAKYRTGVYRFTDPSQ